MIRLENNFNHIDRIQCYWCFKLFQVKSPNVYRRFKLNRLKSVHRFQSKQLNLWIKSSSSTQTIESIRSKIELIKYEIKWKHWSSCDRIDRSNLIRSMFQVKNIGVFDSNQVRFHAIRLETKGDHELNRRRCLWF